MKETFKKSPPQILQDSPSAISSPESVSGPGLCARPVGRTQSASGRDRARASRFLFQELEKPHRMNVTCGPSGFRSSASASLSLSLANKLRVMTDLLGSTLFRLTWKTRVTPAGRLIPALRASGRRKSVRDCTSWPRPQAHDVTERGNTMADHHSFPHDLSNAVKLANWARPSARDWKDTAGMSEMGTNPDGSLRNRMDQLPRQAHLASWARPRAEDSQCVGGASGSGGQRSFTGQLNGFWADAEWIPCRDGKARPVEPGTFPLAHGAAARVGRLRGYGNALVAPQAIGFIKAYMDLCRESARDGEK